jgi:hypothetical protein
MGESREIADVENRGVIWKLDWVTFILSSVLSQPTRNEGGFPAEILGVGVTYNRVGSQTEGWEEISRKVCVLRDQMLNSLCLSSSRMLASSDRDLHITPCRSSTFFFFWWYCDLKSGPHACYADPLQLEPLLQSCFIFLLSPWIASFIFQCWGSNPGPLTCKAREHSTNEFSFLIQLFILPGVNSCIYFQL